MAITSTLRAGFTFAALVALSVAGVKAGRPGEPAIVPGCEPGTKFDIRSVLTWPASIPHLYRPRAAFRCVILDPATIDAYTVGAAAGSKLQLALDHNRGDLAALPEATIPGIEDSATTYINGLNGSMTVKGKVADPVMKCFGRQHPSPDWFYAATIDRLCSVPTDRFGAYDVKLYDLGTKDGTTFAGSSVVTSPQGTVQPVAAYPQVFGKVHLKRTPAKSRCRTEGETFGWKFTARWPTDRVVPRPATFKYTAVICAIHTTKFYIWSIGKYASYAVAALAGSGDSTVLESVLNTNAEVILWRKFDNFTSVSSLVTAPLPANMPNYPVFSCIAKMSPSPDWFVGANSEALCTAHDVRTKTLYKYDAYVNGGQTWTESKPEISPNAIYGSDYATFGGAYMTISSGFVSSATATAASSVVVVAVLLALSSL